MKVNHDLLMAKKILFDTLTWSLPFLDLEKINKIITILRDITKEKQMNLDDLTYGQIKEIQALACKDTTLKQKEILGKHICILQRGWVFIGELSKIGNDCFLDNASVIRSWGTTKGLGEIAENGPIKDKTILDPCPQVRFHYGTLVACIKCKV